VKFFLPRTSTVTLVLSPANFKKACSDWFALTFLVASAAWSTYDGEFKNQTPVKTGSGIDGLKAALSDDTPSWALYQYDEQYLVRIKWRPSAAPATRKVKANQSEQAFLKFAGDKTKVTVEVLGKKNFTHAQIWECIRPGSGQKCIDD